MLSKETVKNYCYIIFSYHTYRCNSATPNADAPFISSFTESAFVKKVTAVQLQQNCREHF
jgi:hypothetical protein